MLPDIFEDTSLNAMSCPAHLINGTENPAIGFVVMLTVLMLSSEKHPMLDCIFNPILKSPVMGYFTGVSNPLFVSNVRPSPKFQIHLTASVVSVEM